MQAAFITQTGPPENIQYGPLPDPRPSSGEVLVRVGAVAVNPIDTYIRSGAVAMDLPNPFVVGCDLAGTVAEVGSDVRRWKSGDRVWGSNQGLLGRQGTFAEFATVDEGFLYATPQRVSDNDAAASALVGITAHLGLVRDAALQPKETLLVHGGAGGVGSMVLQIAKALGARVICTAGSDAKLEQCRQLGADLALHYGRDNLTERVHEFAPQGVQVVWDTRREPDLDSDVGLLAERGRLVVMAGRDARPPFPLGPFYVKGCTLKGFAMFRASQAEQQAAADDLNGWLASGELRAHIDRVLPLAETAAAHRLQEEATVHLSGQLAGKLVLVP